jgi:hypothetical protein
MAGRPARWQSIASGGRRRGPWSTDAAQWAGVAAAITAAVGALLFNALSATATDKQIGLATEQLRLAELSQLDDRYSTAVGQLASDSIEVRLAGVYALDRIMIDAPKYATNIVDVPATFVRTSCPVAQGG